MDLIQWSVLSRVCYSNFTANLTMTFYLSGSYSFICCYAFMIMQIITAFTCMLQMKENIFTSYSFLYLKHTDLAICTENGLSNVHIPLTFGDHVFVTIQLI